MYKLTDLEAETIILYNQAEKESEIYTHDPKLIQVMEEHPQTAILKRVNKFGGRTYSVPKKELIIKLKYHPTGDILKQRKQIAVNMQNARRSKEISE